jgi:hypothetical protein
VISGYRQPSGAAAAETQCFILSLAMQYKAFSKEWNVRLPDRTLTSENNSKLTFAEGA